MNFPANVCVNKSSSEPLLFFAKPDSHNRFLAIPFCLEKL